MANTERRHLNRRQDSSPEEHVSLAELIEQQIFLLRGHKVMLSTNLARLYEAEPRALVQAVKRNIARFPEDFMFQLNEQELHALKSQIVISSWGGMRRAIPYAFTEQGVAMLSSVLRSQRAIQVNIETCGRLSACGVFWHLMPNSLASSMRWRRNTIPSSRSSSMQSAN